MDENFVTFDKIFVYGRKNKRYKDSFTVIS